MRRRDFIKVIAGSAAAALPLAAHAQQPVMPVIGFLSARSPDDTGPVLQAFLKGLGEAGFFDGQNVTIEYRWARGDYSRLPAFAAELFLRVWLDRVETLLVSQILRATGYSNATWCQTFPPQAITALR